MPHTDDPRQAHITFKAVTTTTTDQGVFEAVISTATVDREKDIVEPSAMVTALTKWAALGKMVPLAWAHTEEVVGHIDPATARIANGEVIAKGWVDQNTPRGAEAWRLVKSGTLSFSFGYLIPDGGATKRSGGGLQIKELDVFEISVVPVGPANNDTRVLSFKSAEELRKEADRAAREVEQHQIPDVPEPPKAPDVEVDLVKELQEVKARLATAEQALEDLRTKADETDKGTKSRSVDPLRQQADAMALEIASGGQSLRKPPKTATPPPPELMPLGELKKRMRDEMLGVLSGGPIE